MDPLILLTAFAAIVATSILLFRPRGGLLFRWLRAFRASDRIEVEDALKHVYDCEARGHRCTLSSLAGALVLSGDRTASLVGRLEALGLVVWGEDGYRLSSEGRREALRVIRIHRLWERYLAEETGLSATEWHDEADLREHRTSLEEANSLAAKLGEPRYDPHGDPIPTADGEVVLPKGIPLHELPLNIVGEIVHIEDEPAAIYTQLLAQRLHPHMRVRILERTPERIRFEADAEEHVLAPVFASNLAVLPLPAGEEMEGPFELMSDLEPGQQGRVTGISAACRGPERRRFLDLGIVPGTVVEAEMRSPAGDPTAYRIRGSVIALRQEQANQIRIERSPQGAAA